jgi:exosome complex component CSL4
VSKKSGKPMVLVSWKEMQCPVTGEKERRKCAKPTSLSATAPGAPSVQA